METSMIEKHRLAVFCTPTTKDRGHNLGIYPDWKLNQQPRGAWDNTQSLDPHQLG